MAAPSADMSTLPKLRIGTPMSIVGLPVVAELEAEGTWPVDGLSLFGPAIAQEQVRALVPEIVHEDRGAPAFAFEAHAEVPGVVGLLDLDAPGSHHRLDALEIVDRLADVGEVDSRERLCVQQPAARAVLDTERRRPVRRERQPGTVGHRDPRKSRVQDQLRRLGDLAIVVAERRVELPGVVDGKEKLRLETLDFGAQIG